MFKADSTLLIQIQLALIGIVVVAGLFYLWRIIMRLEERIAKVACKCSVNCKPAPNTKSVAPETQAPYQYMMPPQFDMNNGDENSPEDMLNAQQLMQQVFGGGLNDDQPSMMMFSMDGPIMSHFAQSSPPSGVVVEEMEADESSVPAPSVQPSASPIARPPLQSDSAESSSDDMPDLIDIPGEPITYVATSVEVDDDDVSVSTDSNPLSKSKLSQMKLDKLRELCKARDLSIEGLKPQLIDRLLGLSRE
jgi:hypothetical protein